MMEKEEIILLIENYFDGESTLSEEKWLRECLPSMQGGCPEIDEALAVMGYSAASSAAHVSHRKERRVPAWVVRTAASLALLLTAGGVGLWLDSRGSQSGFLAYAGGVELDRGEAMQIIADQMKEMSEASRSVQMEMEEDLADFRSVFDEPGI